LDGGLVSDGELVVAGGEAAVLFVPVAFALDGVLLPVAGRVERRWATGRRTLFAAGRWSMALGSAGSERQTVREDAGSVGASGQHSAELDSVGGDDLSRGAASIGAAGGPRQVERK